MLKRLCLIVTLILCLIALPAAASTVTVSFCNVELPDGYYMASGTTTPVAQKPGGGYAYLKDGVLTLNNYSLTSEAAAVLSVSNGALEINLVGSNALTTPNGSAIEYGSNASVTIDGTGSLQLKSYYGFHSLYGGQVLTFAGGKVMIEAGYSGIFIATPLYISGGELHITSPNGTGISVGNLDFTISGGTTTVSSKYYGFIIMDAEIIGGAVTIFTDLHPCINSDELYISGADTFVELTSNDEEYGVAQMYFSMDIDSSAKILEPEGGYVANSCFRNADGTIAQHVRIGERLVPPVTPTPIPTPQTTPVPVITPTPAPAVPQTGDTSTLTLWCALAMLAMTAVVLLRKQAYR